MFILFCKEIQIYEEEFKDKIINLKDKKIEGIFSLNRQIINSMNDLRKIIRLEGITRIFNEENSKINGATKFYYSDKLELEGYFVIEIKKDTKNCLLSVYSENQGFRDILTRNILKLISF